MRVPETASAGLAQPGSAMNQQIASGHHSADVDHSNVWQIWCAGYPPAGRRRHWRLIVTSCPFCGPGSAHAHRGGPGGGLRRAECGRGDYLLRARPAFGAAA